jgi:hypothetical protein
MFSIKLPKFHIALVQVLLTLCSFLFSPSVFADGGGANGIPIEISYRDTGDFTPERTCVILLEDVSSRLRQIIIVASVPDGPIDRQILEVERSAKQNWGVDVSTTYAVESGQARIVLDMPGSVHFQAGELLTLSIGSGRISPTMVSFVDEDGIVVTVNIDDFKQTARYPMEIRNLEGKLEGTFNLFAKEEMIEAYSGLVPGLYLIVDPLGLRPTKKYWKHKSC